jgi:alpha-beta hydrolase superfamily lysophospholipase
MQAILSSFRTSDNLSLEVHNYILSDEPEKIILIVHGHGEHGGRYEQVSKFFNEKGYSTAVLTLRGHGNSEGKRGHTPSMEQLILDVEYFIRKIRRNYIEAKIFLYGHSMGGNILLNYLLNDQSNEINAAIIASPWIRLAFEPPQWKVVIGNLIADLIPTFTQKSGLDTEEISTIKEEVQKYSEDPLIHDLISARLFKVIQKGGENILDKAEKIHHPIFLAHGSIDKITDATASAELAEKNDLISFHSYEGSRHEIHHDIGREQLLKDVEEWLRDK